MFKTNQIGYTCVYAPREIFHALGLTPVRAFGSAEAPDVATSYVHPNLCGYVKNIVNACQGQDMVFVDSCTQMKRIQDVWDYFFQGSFSYLLNLPRISTPESQAFWIESLQEMIATLEGVLGRKLEPERLREAIRAYNALGRELGKLEALLLANQIPASQYLALVYQAQRQDVGTGLEQVQAFLAKTPPGGNGEVAPIRLLVSGSIIAGLELARTIEANEANAVYFDTCCTSRAYQDLVDEELEPFEALARKYLGQVPCPRMKSSFERFERLREIVEANQIQGVVYHTLKFCDSAIYESHPFKELLEEREIPVLRIESEYDFKMPGQMSTRIQAFLEML
ncbi:MAG: 2-hydroxyacyl-CoA dehydratase [Candidatus Tectomicrobia bacterium]|uniref:2-hydroxyacyl-CoA dehydratase n=1 Tax=Tectimicrobiota bacterium TaxID=2528274 RepID=A0A932G160_UNCTE|nr:2-hydroxyacyl-CoA dehydratase [Candidatus Tectomicrobia bacterium]